MPAETLKSSPARSAVLLAVIVAVAVGGCVPGHLLYATGPHQGTVVDKETQQPLSGAVVLAIWYRETVVLVSGHGPATDYHDAVETVTDLKGQFTIPERTHFTVVGSIGEPKLVAYHPGYAFFPSRQARPEGEAVRSSHETKVFHVELPKLGAADELEQVRDVPVWLADVPESKMPNLVRLINQQRQAVGLQPIRVGR